MQLLKELTNLIEQDSDCPTKAAFLKAIDDAEKWYEMELQDNNDDNRTDTSVECDLDVVYWNPKTEDFCMLVKDTTKNLNWADDGCWFIVSKSGAVRAVKSLKATLKPPLISTMHSDPTVQAALTAKMGMFRELTDAEVDSLLTK